jgi:hypothetical protein
MRGLPVWMLAGLAVLSGLLVFIGWIDRHEAGYLPFVLGILFSLFTLASLGARAAGEDEG